MKRTDMTDARRRGRSLGFTLIEMLVVLAVLGVLAVAILPDVLGASTAGEVAATEARVQFLAQAIKSYERKVGHYPADNFADLDGVQVKADNVNSGIESLLIALTQQRLGRDQITDHEDWLANTDSDKAGTTLRGLDRTEKVEVVDAWGMPLVYFNSQNGGFGRKQQVRTPEGDTVSVRPRTNPRTGKPAGQFQVLSAGPDGQFGNDDDVCFPPIVREEE